MSVLGSTLLRPQKFARKHPEGSLQIADVLTELASRLLLDASSDKTAQVKIQAGIDAGLNQVKQGLEQKQRSASRKINDFFKPVLDAVKEGANLTNSNNDAAGVISALASLLKLVCHTLQHASADELAEKVNALCDIVENDLGLKTATLSELFRQLVDGIVEELTKDYLNGENSRTAKNNFIIGSRVATLKLLFLQEFEKFNLQIDRQQIVLDFAEELKKRNWDPIIEKIGEITCLLGTATDGTSALFSLDVNVSVNASVNTKTTANRPGKSARRPIGRDGHEPVQFSWYANWALSSRWAPWDYVEVSDRLKLAEEELPEEIVFGDDLSDSFLEHWAHVTDGLTDLAQVTTHSISIEKGDIVSNIVNLVFRSIKGVFTLAAFGHEGQPWMTTFKTTENVYLENFLTLLTSFFASWEKRPKSGGAWAHSFMIPDVSETYLYDMWPNTLRDFTLSLFTLVNADPDAHPDAVNHEKDEGFILLFVELGLLAMAFLPRAFGRKHYGSMFKNGLPVVWAVLGLVGGYGFGLAGWGIAGAISGKNSSETWKWLWLKILVRSFLHYQFYYYLIWEGASNNGQYGLSNGNNEVVMPGYAERSSSPYKLPFKAGKMSLCAEGHYGYWTHNAYNNLVYGVDFTLDYGEAVHAMRGGTVVAWRDDARDGSDAKPNFIVIRHDDPSEPSEAREKHDKNQSGVVTTYAVYLHGRHMGVRHAFAAWGIPAPYITGSRVRQGDLILCTGSTGDCGYDQLHVHVTTKTKNWEIKPFDTIPFVFNDVGSGKGVVKSLNHYVSANEDPSSELKEVARLHPSHNSGDVVSFGNDFVILKDYANENNDFYKGAHLWIEMVDTDGNTFFQYKKIVEYKGKHRKAHVEGGWDMPIPTNLVTKKYRIGGRPFSKADEVGKIFCHLADRDQSNTPIPFPDGRDPYTLTTLSRFHKTLATGELQDGGTLGSNWVKLEASADTNDGFYVNQHLILRQDGNIVAFKKIKEYIGADRKAIIEGEWEKTFRTAATPNVTPDNYLIGQDTYDQAGADTKKFAFFNDHANDDLDQPTNFADGRKPYDLMTYPTWKNIV
ncbi:MAG: M23 family metallopeptidase [Bacteroidota bacterium]